MADVSLGGLVGNSEAVTASVESSQGRAGLLKAGPVELSVKPWSTEA